MKYIHPNKKEWLKGENTRIWKWIKNIQATEHEQSCVTENINIQSEFEKSTYQGNGNKNEEITYILKKGNTKMTLSWLTSAKNELTCLKRLIGD